jgi:FlaA1/EpsC-like NDP-sugar epimerase
MFLSREPDLFWRDTRKITTERAAQITRDLSAPSIQSTRWCGSTLAGNDFLGVHERAAVKWMRVMTILVTGGAGYIGSHMVHALRDLGERVVVLDDLSTGFSWVVPDDVRFVEGDTGDGDLVQIVMQQHEVEAVIHFAASIVVPESMSQPLRYYRNNTANSRTLIEAAVKSGVSRFIFSSTAAV